MTKEEIKIYLTENGASETLLRMPAVMERIYSYFQVNPESMYDGYCGIIRGLEYIELPNTFRRMLKVGPNGEIVIKNENDIRRFEERPNGEAVYKNEDQTTLSIDENGEYLIDRYGMDKSFTSEMGLNISRRDNGTIKVARSTFTDNGSPILNAYAYLAVYQDESVWDANKEELTRTYPITREWFEIREKQRQLYIDEQNKEQSHTETQQTNNTEELTHENEALRKQIEDRDSSIGELQSKLNESERENKELKRQIDDNSSTIETQQKMLEEKDVTINSLQTEKADYQRRYNKVVEMLRKSLDKLQEIKSHFLGRFFFPKDERNEDLRKQLPEGRDSNNER